MHTTEGQAGANPARKPFGTHELRRCAVCIIHAFRHGSGFEHAPSQDRLGFCHVEEAEVPITRNVGIAFLVKKTDAGHVGNQTGGENGPGSAPKLVDRIDSASYPSVFIAGFGQQKTRR